MINKFCVCPHTKQRAATFGFSLIELLIAMFVTAIVGGAIVSNYIVQQRAATRVRQVAHMQQQIRGAITVMSEDIRLAGLNRNPDDQNSPFGILNIGKVDMEDEAGEPISATDGDGNTLRTNSITLAYDFDRLRPNIAPNSFYQDGDGNTLVPTTMNRNADEPFYEYRLYNEGNDNTSELARYVYNPGTSEPSRRELLAENIEAIAFAYAFDADEDGLLDRDGASPNPIWAIDTDGDNVLDTNLDANGDGNITEDDDTNGDKSIDSGDGGSLSAPVPRTAIRAVRIWLMACTGPAQGYEEDANRSYLVGDRIFNPQEGDLPVNRRRMVMRHIVNCRNMWPTKHM